MDTAAIDFETASSCDITVRATSADQSTSSTTFTVLVTDVDDVAPSFTSSASITMNENVQDVVSLTVTDADSTAAPTYTLSGTDSDLFQVNSGTLRFASSTGQNFESMTCSANPCTVTVTATDAGGNTGTQVVSVTIQDVNEFSPEFGTGTRPPPRPTRTSRRSAPTRPGRRRHRHPDLLDPDRHPERGQRRPRPVQRRLRRRPDLRDGPQLRVRGLRLWGRLQHLRGRDPGHRRGNTDTITVTVNVQDVNEFSPEFGTGTRPPPRPTRTSRRSAPTRPRRRRHRHPDLLDPDRHPERGQRRPRPVQRRLRRRPDLRDAPNYESAGCGSGTTPTPAWS